MPVEHFSKRISNSNTLNDRVLRIKFGGLGINREDLPVHLGYGGLHKTRLST